MIFRSKRTQYPGGISSAGRAPALQAGGRRFDPVILHQVLLESANVSQSTRLWFRFDLLEINAVSFFNNLEEVKIIYWSSLRM